MPRTEEENQRVREEQKRNILEGAIRVFARKGFAATKMADIAAEAGVSYGLVYHYFPNKEQALDELLEGVIKKVAAMTQQALEMPGTPLERLHWLLSIILQHLRQRPQDIIAFHQIIRDGAVSHTKKWEMGCKCNTFSIDAMRRLIIEGQSIGQIADDDPDQLVVAIQACIRGLAFSALSQDREKDFPSVDIVLRLLKPC